MTLTQSEWRILKRTTRARRHKQRLEQMHEADPRAWLLAVDRDDRTDKGERKQKGEVRP